MPTQAQLQAMDYANNPRQKGLLVREYDEQFSQHGESIRAWEAYPDCPATTIGPNGERVEKNGCLYIEKALDPTLRVLITNYTVELQEEEFATIVRGRANIACDPALLELGDGDRVLLTDHLVLRRVAIETTGNETDSLIWPFAAQIISVIGDGQVLPSASYSLQAGNGAASLIQWADTPPGVALVAFRYHPRFSYLSLSDKNPPKGADGLRLLQRGLLSLDRV